MKGKILFLVSLLILAIFIAGCNEQTGEAGKTLAAKAEGSRTKIPISQNPPPEATKTPSSGSATTRTPAPGASCTESAVKSCEGNVLVVTKTFVDCTTSVVSRDDCVLNGKVCGVSAGVNACV